MAEEIQAAKPKTSVGLDENILSALAYVLIWVSGIIVYLLEKENQTVKFHAMQSIITFLPLSIISWLFWWTFFIPVLISVIMFILWIVLIIKAYTGEKWKVPIAGDFAEKETSGK
jgi:uncharacterized membrane protein